MQLRYMELINEFAHAEGQLIIGPTRLLLNSV